MHIGYRGFGVFGSSEYKPETLKLDTQTRRMAKQTGDDKVLTYCKLLVSA